MNKEMPAPSQTPQAAFVAALAAFSIAQIAAFVRSDWGAKTNFAAKPYLDAMLSLHDLSGAYGADSAKEIVLYFLSNATSYRGENAKAVKAELKARLKAAGVRL